MRCMGACMESTAQEVLTGLAISGLKVWPTSTCNLPSVLTDLKYPIENFGFMCINSGVFIHGSPPTRCYDRFVGEQSCNVYWTHTIHTKRRPLYWYLILTTVLCSTQRHLLSLVCDDCRENKYGEVKLKNVYILCTWERGGEME